MIDRDHLERLLREPNNLFGLPKGRGYDYGRAAILLAALAATAVSSCALLLALNQPDLPPLWRAVLLIVGIPNLIGFPFLWPLNLLVGMVTSFVLWLTTFYVLAWLCGWREAGRASRWCSALGAVAGWILGIAIGSWQFVRWDLPR